MKNDRQKVRVPVDNYGRVYVGLLESDLSAHAKLCFGAMWSFGQGDVWASVPAIARRMSVSVPTVRKAQAELLKAGWIELLEDSKGGKTKVWMMKTEGKKPEGSEAEPETAFPVDRKRHCGLTGNAVAGNKELNQEPEKITTPTNADEPLNPKASPEVQAPVARPAAVGEILGAFRDWWKIRYPGKVYVAGPGDGEGAVKISKAGATLDQVLAALKVWPSKADDYTRERGCPFWLFVREFNRLQLAAPAGPACSHPTEAFVEKQTFRDGTRYGSCSACGAFLTIQPTEEK